MNEVTTLQMPVLMEPLADRPGYVAHLGAPFNLSVEAGTPEEALRELTRAIETRLQGGGHVVSLALPMRSTSAAAPGWLPDDELTKEWLEIIEERRRENDEADRRRILGGEAEEKAAS